MTYLLDTHAFVWAVVSPERLGTKARAVIEDAGNNLFVSAASAWEISTKARVGKWPDAVVLLDGFAAAVRRLRAAPLDVTHEDGLLAGRMEWEHRDPFDRMLVAQAMTRGLRIVTRDEAILAHPVATIW